jgi:Putative auto-transporter adhesin, head GIN domain
MNTPTKKALRLNMIAGCAAAALAVLCSLTANAQESRSNRGDVSLFGMTWSSNTNYGNNRTKGSGVVKEETRSVANFSQLQLNVPATVSLMQGANESLSIQVDDNLLPLIRSRVEGGTLIIDADKDQGFSTKKGIKIKLAVKTLDAIDIKGSGDVFGDQLKGEKLNIAIMGSGDIKFKSLSHGALKITIKGSGDFATDNVEAKTVETSIYGSGDIRFAQMKTADASFRIHGSGDISASGSAEKVDVEIQGSGDVRVGKLIAREANVKIQASGDAEVHASEKLNASVSGSGDIRYNGAPKDVVRNVRGSGSITAR